MACEASAQFLLVERIVGRDLRRLEPDAVWSVTSRCIRAEFRVKPTQRRMKIIGYWLARAQRKFSGIRIYAFVTNVSHFHIEFVDTRSEASRFLNLFLGEVAKRINGIDGVYGPFWESRFHATEVLDQEAIIERIVYTVTNPVAANLVRSYREWTGMALWHGNCKKPMKFHRFLHGDFKRAVERAKKTGERVEQKDFYHTVELVIDQPPGIEDAVVEEAIAAREKEIDERREGQVLGIDKVRALDPFTRSRNPKRNPKPLCHATSVKRRSEYKEKWRAFVAAYREASEAFRTGDLSVVFPDCCFRPALPFAFNPS